MKKILTSSLIIILLICLTACSNEAFKNNSNIESPEITEPIVEQTDDDGQPLEVDDSEQIFILQILVELDIYSQPDGEIISKTTIGEEFPVEDMTTINDKDWYCIGDNEWITATEEQITFFIK